MGLELFKAFNMRIRECAKLPPPSLDTVYVVYTNSIAVDKCDFWLGQCEGDLHEYWSVDRAVEVGSRVLTVKYCTTRGVQVLRIKLSTKAAIRWWI
jgi:hypothetical protein